MESSCRQQTNLLNTNGTFERYRNIHMAIREISDNLWEWICPLLTDRNMTHFICEIITWSCFLFSCFPSIVIVGRSGIYILAESNHHVISGQSFVSVRATASCTMNGTHLAFRLSGIGVWQSIASGFRLRWLPKSFRLAT